MRITSKKIPILICLVLLILGLMVGGCEPEEVDPEVDEEIGEIRIALLNSMTGAFAPAGALAGHRGNLIAIEMMNERGGVLGEYEIVPIEVDSESDVDTAIREAERLIELEEVPVIVGVYSSGIATPLAPLCNDMETILWINIAISDGVVQDRGLEYVFRVQPMGSQWGAGTVELINNEYEQFGVDSPAELTAAVIYEDGPYGDSCATSNKELIDEFGMELVYEDSYPHDTDDLTSLILRLNEADPDVVFHTGYYPDIVLFLRQAQDLGFTTGAYLGHGAGHAALYDIAEDVGEDVVNYFFNVDPAPAQLLDPDLLDEGLGDLNQEFLRRVEEEYGLEDPATHYTQGFAHMWILLDEVLPRAIEEYGGVTPDAIRQAALDLDIPEGGTPAGYGVQFAPPDHELSGQNLRSYPSVMQLIDGELAVTWPEALRTEDPVIPLPPEHPFGR